MKIGVIHEPQDARVAIGPDIASQLIDDGNEMLMETKAGEAAYFQDDIFAEKGVKIYSTAKDVLKEAEIIISLQPLKESLWDDINPEAVLVSSFQPYVDATISEKLTARGFTVFSLDMIPRTTLAQSMDVLSSMGSIAGYRAVLEAATHLPRYFPMLSSAAGTIAPAKILVLGAGVAGLQAIATAKRLGGMVEAFDTRAATKEEVLSLGAKFVEVEGAKDDTAAGGYAVEQTEEYKLKQRALIAEKSEQADVIITTAQVRGPKAPILITKEIVEKMKPGSVIVDLAASTGGNCELTQNQKTIVSHNHVTIIGNSDLSSKVSLNATQLYGRNVLNFLRTMLKEGKFEPDWENQIIRESCISRPKEMSQE